MAWAVWVRSMRGPVLQKVFDGVGDKPFLDEAIKSSVLSQHKLTTEEDEMWLEDLAGRYPAPKEAVAS